MAEINNSLAAQVNAGQGVQPLDLTKTLGAISQIQLAQAHAGLYGLQAQQEARKLQGLEYLKGAPSDYTGAIQRGLDPSVGNTLQTMGERERQYKTNPNGLSTESTLQLTSAGKNIAETGKIGVETSDKKLEVGARIAQMILTDPSDAGIERAHEAARAAGVDTNPLTFNQFLRMPVEQRVQAAKSKLAAGISSNDYTEPHNVPPTNTVTSRAGVLNAPGSPVQTGQATPNAQVASRFGSLPAPMTPMQAKEGEGYGEQLSKALPALGESADNSRRANFTLDQMRRESETWNMGKGGTALMTAQQYLKPIANSMGSTMFDKPVADFEAFQKNTGVLVRQAVKEVSSRAAVQEFSMIQNQLPSANMSRQGFNQISDQFQAVNDYNIAKHQAAQAWRDATGTMDKFDAEWNKNVTPSAFLVARLPPDQLGALRANLQRTPEGRATLGSINKQLKWAHDHNLDQLVR
jgi:hypothetical protein